MIRKSEKAELRFIPMELDVRGFYSNWFYSHEARCFLFKGLLYIVCTKQETNILGDAF